MGVFLQGVGLTRGQFDAIPGGRYRYGMPSEVVAELARQELAAGRLRVDYARYTAEVDVGEERA